MISEEATGEFFNRQAHYRNHPPVIPQESVCPWFQIGVVLRGYELSATRSPGAEKPTPLGE
jgi:hypothetical protein